MLNPLVRITNLSSGFSDSFFSKSEKVLLYGIACDQLASINIEVRCADFFKVLRKYEVVLDIIRIITACFEIYQ